MTVIARNSTFAYKGKAVDMRQAAQELGVRYVVEGSVRQGGNRLRIHAQLIDSKDGAHVWAERYDRVVDDIFDIQDEITKEIVTALRVNLSDGEKAIGLSRGTTSVQAWGHCVQALEFFFKYNAADHAKARELAENALKFDPDYPMANAVLGYTFWTDSRIGYTSEAGVALARAKELAERAIALDDTSPWTISLNEDSSTNGSDSTKPPKTSPPWVRDEFIRNDVDSPSKIVVPKVRRGVWAVLAAPSVNCRIK